MTARVLRNLSTSRAEQIAKLTRAAEESPALAGLFTALRQALETSIDVPFHINESFRWTPVQVQTLLLADQVLRGEL